jgi:hypothetical protein
VIVTSSKAPIRAENRLKEAANSLTRWANDNCFKISPEKTKTMLIHRRRPRIEGNTSFKLRVLIGMEKIEMLKKRRTPRHKLSERCWIMKDRVLPSYESPVTMEYQVMKRPIKHRKKCWMKIYQPLKDTRQTT